MSTAELLDALSDTFTAIVGTPEQVIAPMQAYAKAGAEEMMIQWFIFDSIQGLEILAEDVLPHFMTQHRTRSIEHVALNQERKASHVSRKQGNFAAIF